MKKKLAKYGMGGAGIASAAVPIVGSIVQAIMAGVEAKKAKKQAAADFKRQGQYQASTTERNNLMYSEAVLGDYQGGTGQSDYFAALGGRIPLRRLAHGGYFTATPTDGYYGNTGYSKAPRWGGYSSGTKIRDSYSGYVSEEELALNKDNNNNPYAPTSGNMSINKYDGSVQVKPGFHMTQGIDAFGNNYTATNENRQSWVDVKNNEVAGPVINTMEKMIDNAVGIPIGSLFDMAVGAMDKSVRKNRGDSRFDSKAEETAAQNKWANQRTSYQESKNRVDQASFNGNSERGNDNVDIYAALGADLKKFNMGGISTTGGKAIPLDGESYLMKGKTHGEGGIKLNKGGEDIAEVETGEVVTEDGEAFTDRMKLGNGNTFADERVQIGIERNITNNELSKLDNNMQKTNDKYKGNNYKRTALNGKAKLAALEQKENSLFRLQQILNGGNGETQSAAYGGKLAKFNEGGYWGTSSQFLPPKDENIAYADTADETDNTMYGGDNTYYGETNPPTADYPYQGTPITLGTSTGNSTNPKNKNNGKRSADWQKAFGVVGNLATYADNIYNAHLINSMPPVPIPMRKVYQNLETRVNTNRRITAIKDAVYSSNKDIDRNTGASNMARTQKMANYVRGLEGTVDIIGDAESREQAGRNANISGANAVANANIDTVNQYDTDVFNNQLYKTGLRSANMANATADFNQQRWDDKYNTLEKEKLGIMSRGYQSSGVTYNAMGTPDFDSMVKSDPDFARTLWEKVKNDPTQKAKYIKHYGTPK